jgi:diaminohydroxyphosphoribosylaminopyrimidine deaminase / 5-amino-6-(5-phosphoribosylamino)uracil reductase
MAPKTSEIDLGHMQAALALSRRNLGRTWPNPSVGCVIVKDGIVVGRGWTQSSGRPHAETEALRRAGAAARGATAYVTLEPCCHHGKTPPCTEALIAAGVARVVAALEDPDPRVSGRGIAALRQAEITVDVGIGAEEAAEINAGFLMLVRNGRPLVTLKAATTLDGRIATHKGESQWITGPAARARGHLLRATHDAVMVGVGTAVSDDPELTCRLPGFAEHAPVRIVVDPRLRLPLTSRLVRTAAQRPTWIIAQEGNEGSRVEAFAACGITVLEVPVMAQGELNVDVAFHELGARGLTRVLVEGGSRLTGALLRAGFVDRIAWFRAPTLMGGDGVAVAVAFGVDTLEQAPRFRRRGLEPCGDDMLEIYERV